MRPETGLPQWAPTQHHTCPLVGDRSASDGFIRPGTGLLQGILKGFTFYTVSAALACYGEVFHHSANHIFR